MNEAKFWKGKYETLLLAYCELTEALGYLAPDIGDVFERHYEALARAKWYRKLVTDCSLDNPEEWDD